MKIKSVSAFEDSYGHKIQIVLDNDKYYGLGVHLSEDHTTLAERLRDLAYRIENDKPSE
ncbi:MAG: hypothetical protein OEY89_12235 [Gammaproteobacteria bacterium]|nr:hypothetical protein [Gammaproteobacteria bacterium]